MLPIVVEHLFPPGGNAVYLRVAAWRGDHMRQRQRTVSRSASVQGQGLFSGEPANLTIAPAEAGAGILFVRQYDGKTARIPALVSHVVDRPRRTCLKNGTLFVQTVEHCMAALAGVGIDNAVVTLEGGANGELPGGDGSSQAFVRAIEEAGPIEQEAKLSPLVIRKPMQVEQAGATLAALPGTEDCLEILYDFEAPAPVGRQLFAFRLGDEDFATQVAPARTFVFENEAAELRARGMGEHLSPKDLLVIAADGPIDNQFRFADECVRHKVLDLIGDLFLVGRPIRGRIVARRSGHSLNHLLARRLLEQELAHHRASLVDREAVLDIRRIQRILPHRYPMLLVDRILEIQGDERVTGIKNVTFNDAFFQGHYPGTPIMPAVLVVEAMAQISGVLLDQKLEHKGKVPYLISMDKVKVRQAVVPGDQLLLEAVTVRVKSRTGHVRCKAFVREKLAAEADIKFMLVDAESA